MSESELSDIDELAEMEDRTNDDGSVDVTIEGWNRNGSHMTVEFELIDSVEKENMSWPQPGDRLTEYKFYRLIDQAGLTMRNADLLEGESVNAVREDGSWVLQVDENRSVVDTGLSVSRALYETICSIRWAQVIITIFWIVSVVTIIDTILQLL